MAILLDGLVAIGGEITPARLLRQYRRGVFPWYMDGQPPLWWSPDPRLVFPGCEVHASRSLRRRLARDEFSFTLDRAFEQVIDACAARDETWITADVRAGYVALHRAGHAHSIEVWHDRALVGGLYGVALGRVFFGESMFSRATDASKAALVTLAGYLRRRGFILIDGQVPNPHLERMGGVEWDRATFLRALADAVQPPDPVGHWTFP